MHATAHCRAAELAISVYQDVLSSVHAGRLVSNSVRLEEGQLIVQDKSYQLDSFERVFVCGAGKASFAMAEALTQLLGSSVSSGIVITKEGHGGSIPRIDVVESSHPIPDARSLQAGDLMLEFARRTTERDLVLFGLSGGASSLMESLVAGVSLTQLQNINKLLLATGLNIGDINAVRSRLSKIKAGKLGAAFLPATVCVLSLSDVPLDHIETIGSGPFWNDASDEWIPMPQEENLEPLNLTATTATHFTGSSLGRPLPSNLGEILSAKLGHSLSAEFRKDLEPPVYLSSRISHRIIGSSVNALLAGHSSAQSKGLKRFLVKNTPLQFDARVEAKRIVDSCSGMDSTNDSYALFAGEPTVVIRGEGVGGRCQELACVAADLISGMDGFAVLAGSTDGTDGPTDVAGAVVDGNSEALAATLGITAGLALSNSDSFSFLKACDGLIHSGPTQSNVNDVVIVVRTKNV